MSSPTGPAPAPRLDHLTSLVALQEEFAASIAEVPPDARVPWCGRWQVRHVVVHLARIHHWAAAQARGGREVPLGRGPFDLEPLYRTCAAELAETLRALDPDATSSTLLGRGPASFWHRRQLHETLVHLWDVRTAGGLPVAVGPRLWADTVDEVVTVMHPRQVRLGRTAPLTATVALVADDVAAGDGVSPDEPAADGAAGGAGRRWCLDTDAADDAADPAAGTAVEVHGPASALALLLWGRTTPDDDALAVVGDRAVLDAALAGRLTP